MKKIFSLLVAAAFSVPLFADQIPESECAQPSGTYLFAQKDSADLIEKLERFLSLSPERQREMGLAGRAKMEREFDRRIVIGKYLEAIGSEVNP